MKISIEDEEQVILHTDDGKKKSVCLWTSRCPGKPVWGIEASCEQCPARKVIRRMDFSEAVEWWKSAKLVQH